MDRKRIPYRGGTIDLAISETYGVIVGIEYPDGEKDGGHETDPGKAEMWGKKQIDLRIERSRHERNGYHQDTDVS